MTRHTVHIRPDEATVARDAAAALVQRIRDRQGAGGHAHIVVTGGGVGTMVLAALVTADIDWSAIDLWWGDERFLPEGHPDRNATQAQAALLDQVPIPAAHVHAMPADTGQGAEQAARDYADELAGASVNGVAPDFEVLLLGVGPEGHVASIFPHSPAAAAAAPVVAVHNSPKPPPTRVSMTFPTLRGAREVWLVASGQEKAEAIAAALAADTNPVDVPAAGAVGRVETVVWLDEAAASALTV
ncbi:MAG: 6-phosphogluconolactonase [Candidatus Nanopelagicales bacterium]|jgi:6-phosphogluconolactonase